MIKIIDDKKIKVYVKGKFEIGDELDIAEELLTQSFIGLKQFVFHLKNKEDALDCFEKFCRFTEENKVCVLDLINENFKEQKTDPNVVKLELK